MDQECISDGILFELFYQNALCSKCEYSYDELDNKRFCNLKNAYVNHNNYCEDFTESENTNED